MTDEQSCVQFIDRAARELGGIDILYNNAGLALGRYPFTESTPMTKRPFCTRTSTALFGYAPRAPAHPRRGPHPVHGLDRGQGCVPERRRLRRREIRLARVRLRAARGPARAPIRITTVDPGLSRTEFSLVRFKGDVEAAEAPYVGVEPLTPDDVAECVLFAVTRPLHVNIDEMVIKALAQSSGGRILRNEA